MNKLVFLLIIPLFLAFGAVHAQTALNFYQLPLQSSTCNFLSPLQIQSAYGFNSLYSAGYNGAGQSVAIIVAHGDPTLQSDVNTYDSEYGLSPLTEGSNLVVVEPFGQPSSYSSHWTAETAIDVEIVHALAPGAKIYLVVAPNSSWLFNALNYTVNNMSVDTVSISWGSSEEDYNSQGINYINSILSNGEQKGINFFVASGDAGAYNNLSNLNVNFPASSPNVVAVGGTSLSVSSSGTYEGEVGWNRSGGGQSQFFSRLPFQPDLGSGRLVPDVSFNAGTPLCIYEDSSWGGFYGTSLAAPSWAALDAILNQKLGGDMAFLDKSLYQAYNSYGSITFNNITSGCNGYYCADGAYNEVSGLGSPKAYSLVQVLSKAGYTISFDSSQSGAIFDVNGVNYSSSITLNFTYGQKIIVKAYSTNISAYKRAKFSSFSGILNSASDSAQLFVNASGVVNINYNLQFGVNIVNYMGIINKTEWENNGSTFSFSTPARVNNSNGQYTIYGISVDGGPAIQQDSYSLQIFSPVNFTLIWFLSPAERVGITNGIPQLYVNVKFDAYVPLSNSTKVVTETIHGSGVVFPVTGSVLYLSSPPQYIGGYRYIMENTSAHNAPSVNISFYKEQRYTLTLLSKSNSTILPSSITVSFDGINESFTNGTLWVPYNGHFYINQVLFDGLNILPAVQEFSSSSAASSLSLPVSNINLSVSTSLGIPVIGAAVRLYVGNSSINKTTSFLGSVAFPDVPDKPYNLSISAYGSKYLYTSLTGQKQNIVISPLLYQSYIIAGILALVLVILAAAEVKHRKKKRGF